MKVKDLIKQLQDLNPNSEVILQTDQQGNGYESVRGAELAIRGSDDEGVVYNPKWTASDCCLEAEEWESLKKKKSAQVVVIFP